ncbi:uncharacterized protein [Littorina saxatilis]|uniref:Mutator-like transposase domain-containing protein n=1 Tax=Littorina saxatilis TaxID=31220 RepID=A0AAN9GGW8_9CAEN
MDLPPPVAKNSYIKIDKSLEEATCTVQQQSMNEAAKLEYSLATAREGREYVEDDEEEEDDDEEDQGEEDPIRNIDVSSDGTWMTRGHSSNVGAASTIGCKTGKVIGCGARSKICKSCEVWEKEDKNIQEIQEVGSTA